MRDAHTIMSFLDRDHTLAEKLLSLPDLMRELKNTPNFKLSEEIVDELLIYLNPLDKQGVNFHLLKYIDKYLKEATSYEAGEVVKEEKYTEDAEEIEDIQYNKEYMEILGIKNPEKPWEE